MKTEVVCLADFIMIVPERVRAEAGRIRDCHESYIDVMDRLNNLVVNLADIWEGQAYDAFVSKYKDIQQEMNKFSEVFHFYSKEMETISNNMENTDMSLASKINGLS